jgi:pSer/pThr/pTyr-binding forkhead associated (FHA) protein
MRVAILVRSGTTTKRRIVLKGGQMARFGRTDWADFAFPEDSALSAVHFAIHCGVDSAQLQALSQEHPTVVNESPVTQVSLKHGDIIRAGNSAFQVQIEGAELADGSNPADANAANVDSEPDGRAEETLLLAQYLELSEDAVKLASGCQDRNLFSSMLVDKKLLEDAVRWNAHVLPKPESVLWGCRCVESDMKSQGQPAQQSAFKAAAQWGNQPTEENRKEALRWAEAVNYDGMGGSLAAAAAWSGGSLASDNLPIVSPDDRLTGRAVVVALTIALNATAPPDPMNRRNDFLSRLPKAIASKHTI